MKRLQIIAIPFLILILLYGCVSTKPEIATKDKSLQKSSESEIYSKRKENRYSSREMLYVDQPISSIFKGDNHPINSLKKSIQQSIKYLSRIPGTTIFNYGKLKYTATEVIASMQLFQEILDEKDDREIFLSRLDEDFHAFESPANYENGVLFTGYYEPQFHGSLTQSAEYNIPVYHLPDNRHVLELGDFRKSLEDRTIVYRKEEGEVVPYFTRREIMEQGALQGENLEIAWMRDPIDLFIIQVQGSGTLILPSGEKVKIMYEGSNGRPYSSIGKLLIEEGKLTLEEVSLQSIRKYLQDHPEERDRILYHNESYIFFRLETNSEDGPRGNINVPITPLRSIATDSSIFPKGGLAYISTDVPSFDPDLKRIESKPFSHFVLNQDTGGAIRGVDRVDLFWGNGPTAERGAGSMRNFGKIYFLIAKKHLVTIQKEQFSK